MLARVAIVGHRVDAAVDSARRAGFDPVCIVPADTAHDGLDAVVHQAPADAFPKNVLPLLRRLPIDVEVIALPPLQGHVDVLRAIAFERPMMGCSPEAVVAACHPTALQAMPQSKVIHFPDVRLRSSLRFRLKRLVFGAWTRTRYLRKPIHGSQGEGIDWWSPGDRLDETHYLQQYIKGIAMSAIFRGDGWSSVLLGVVEQLVGEPWCSAGPWHPCGEIGPVQLSEATRTELGHLGAAVTQRHDVRGLFAIDLIQDPRGRLWPIGIEPHHTPGVTVLERALGFAALTGAGPVVRKGRSRPATGPAVAGRADVAGRVVTADGATRDAVEAALRAAATSA